MVRTFLGLLSLGLFTSVLVLGGPARSETTKRCTDWQSNSQYEGIQLRTCTETQSDGYQLAWQVFFRNQYDRELSAECVLHLTDGRKDKFYLDKVKSLGEHRSVCYACASGYKSNPPVGWSCKLKK